MSTAKRKETYYKVLNADGACYHGGTGKWHLPQDGKPGEWMPEIKGKLVPCVHGYHILKREHLLEWIAPVSLFEVEVKGPVKWDENKGVVRQARLIRSIPQWTEQTARLFSCDCAEHYRQELPEGEHAEFDKCVLTIRRYVFGWATNAELEEPRAWAWARARTGAWAGVWARAGAVAVAGVWAVAVAGVRARAGAWAWAWAWAWAGAGAGVWARAWARAWARTGAWTRERDIQWETDRLFDYLEGKVDIDAIKERVKPQ